MFTRSRFGTQPFFLPRATRRPGRPYFLQGSSTWLLGWLLLTLFGLANAPASAQPERPRIDPAGISGSLLVLGESASSEAYQLMLRLAAADQPAGEVVVLVANPASSSTPVLEKLTQAWSSQTNITLRLLPFPALPQARGEERTDAPHRSTGEPDPAAAPATLAAAAPLLITARTALASATTVLLLGNDATRVHPAFHDPACRDAIQAMLLENRVVALCQTAPRPWFAGESPQSGETEGEASEAIAPSFLAETQFHFSPAPQGISSADAEPQANSPDEESEAPFQTAFAENPASIGVTVTPTAALLFRGRRLFALGSGEVQVSLAESPNKPAQQFTLPAPTRQLDWIATRRAAWDRVGSKFPPDQPRPTQVSSGSLILIGGGGMPDGIIADFVKRAGGGQAVILLLPTALPDPLPAQRRLRRAFEAAGAGEVHVLPGRTRDVVESEEYQELFERATGLWFGGGRQWRFVDAYQDTSVEPLMHAVLERGGVIMGSSAGASIQAEFMARGTPIGNTAIIADGYERGLGFLPGAAVDQHFRQRNRFADMSKLMTRYPQLLGIGIDESTALVVEGQIGTVVGEGAVHFYDARSQTESDGTEPDSSRDYVSVWPTGRYDLVEREIIKPGSQPPKD